jgi:hypothetical protein
MDERLAALRIVESRLKKETPTPLLRQLWSVLRRARPRAKGNPLVERIDGLRANIPQSDDLVIFDAFSTGEWDHDVFYDNIEDGERSRRELISRGVAAFRKKFPAGRQQVDGIVELVRDAEACGITCTVVRGVKTISPQGPPSILKPFSSEACAKVGEYLCQRFSNSSRRSGALSTINWCTASVKSWSLIMTCSRILVRRTVRMMAVTELCQNPICFGHWG